MYVCVSEVVQGKGVVVRQKITQTHTLKQSGRCEPRKLENRKQRGRVIVRSRPRVDATRGSCDIFFYFAAGHNPKNLRAES